MNRRDLFKAGAGLVAGLAVSDAVPDGEDGSDLAFGNAFQGDFDSHELHCDALMRFLDGPPAAPRDGDMYFDARWRALQYFDGKRWQSQARNFMLI